MAALDRFHCTLFAWKTTCNLSASYCGGRLGRWRVAEWRRGSSSQRRNVWNRLCGVCVCVCVHVCV